MWYMKCLSLLLSVTKSNLLAKQVKVLAIRCIAKAGKGHEFLNLSEKEFIFIKQS